MSNTRRKAIDDAHNMRWKDTQGRYSADLWISATEARRTLEEYPISEGQKVTVYFGNKPFEIGREEAEALCDLCRDTWHNICRARETGD